MSVLKFLWEKFAGVKTYTALALLIANQLSATLGLGITSEQWTQVINIILAILAGIFRAMAKEKEQEAPAPV